MIKRWQKLGNRYNHVLVFDNRCRALLGAELDSSFEFVEEVLREFLQIIW